MAIEQAAALLAEVRACTVCAAQLAAGPRPIVQFSATASIVIIGQRRAEIMGQNADLRRSYVRMWVGSVSINDNDIVVAGSTAVLEAAATKGNMKVGPAVRGFGREWCQKRDRDVSTKRYITMHYYDFSAFDTVENTVLASALVLVEDSNRCGRSVSNRSATPEFILRPADNFLPWRGGNRIKSQPAG